MVLRRVRDTRKGALESQRYRYPASPLQRIARHQLVRMLPARQRLHALEPGADVLVRARDIEAELLDWIIEIGAKGQIGDRRPRSEHELAACQPLVDDCEIPVDAALEERE